MSRLETVVPSAYWRKLLDNLTYNFDTARVLETRQTFTIGQAADQLGVSPSWLRFGERLGSLPLARRTPRGWRYYTPEDVERLRRLGVGTQKRRRRSGDE
jgi:MerR HTH family regulatory protein